MKDLYLKILELLQQINEIKYIDLDLGQLTEEKPPLAYPSALIDIGLSQLDDMGNGNKEVSADFSIRLVFKAMGETNNITSETQRLKALDYFSLVEKVLYNLDYYSDNHYYPFSCTSIKTESIRKGLKVIRLSFSTSWHDYTANSKKDTP